jgi:hypothetical protein
MAGVVPRAKILRDFNERSECRCERSKHGDGSETPIIAAEQQAAAAATIGGNGEAS